MNELALYNEIDDFAADWLENLIRADLIAPGVVDRRSIVDLTPDDVARYRQVHFFAGIGVWSYSLRKAGWPDDRPIWTGSCPCQPFSAAGKGGGFDDERHLWPAFFHLIEQCCPAVVLGEQVASKDGLAWLELVQTDMEGADYAIGAVDTCSASVGAPHIRQRLRFAAVRMADAERVGREWWQGISTGREHDRPDAGRNESHHGPVGIGKTGTRQLADADDAGSQGRLGVPERADQCAPGALGMDGGLADADGRNACSEWLQRSGQHGLRPQDSVPGRRGDQGIGHNAGPELDRPGPTNGFWRDADWLFCRDGKWRPVESGTFPLAHGAASRVGRLRAYGNAVDAEATREFCEAVIGSIGDCLT